MEAHRELTAAWGEGTPSLRTIQRWMKDVSEETRMELSDAPRCSRPSSTRTDEITEKVGQMIEEDPHLSYCDLAKQPSCDHITILRILREDL